ncbi:MAG: hypothetical protein QF521_03825 [Alphaproteobacteria bacterium]|jgi:hypothetical protein|nr:hypothetical protein [Alphaproteobacteria bacterium]
MDMFFPLFAVGVALVTTLFLIANAPSRPFPLRVAALACAAALMALGYSGFAELLGRAKPVSHEWERRGVGEATVLASSQIKGKAIYLWLRFAGSDEPRAYVLPWSRQAARNLRSAQRQAKANRTSVLVKQPFETNLETQAPRFQAKARPIQPALPKKTLASRQPPT